jgi:hypothetical protein
LPGLPGTNFEPKLRMMRKSTLTLFAILILMAGPIQSQDTKDTIYRNAVKMNLAATLFRNLSFSYDRQLNEHWSLQMGAGYKVGGNIPKFIGLGDFAVTSETSGIRGYSLTPEVRYHIRNCDCKDQTGLYIGAYGRGTWFHGELEFRYWNGTEYVDVGGAGDMREYGFGLQLGYQVTIKKRLIVDLMFMGPRTSFQRLKLELDPQFASEIIPLIEEEINERLAWWGMDPISMSDDPSAVVDFRFTNFRYAIGIGFLF